MNLIIAVATTSNERVLGFLESLSRCYLKGSKVLILGTMEEINLNYLLEHIYYINPIVKNIEPRKRMYAEVMQEKINFVSEIATEDTIVVMVDDDYDFNKFAFAVTKKIFIENPQVNYLSLLKAGDVICNNPISMSGFDFYCWHSCMGGSMIVRWSDFKEKTDSFFNKYGIDNQFDQLFWDHLTEKTGINEHVYTLYDFSLCQHCNIGSSYRDSTGEYRNNHAYGVIYDPRQNPFITKGIPEINIDNIFTCGDK